MDKKISARTKKKREKERERKRIRRKEIKREREIDESDLFESASGRFEPTTQA